MIRCFGLWTCLALGVAAQAAKSVSDFTSPAPPDHALAAQVLSVALQNQYQGRYTADLDWVKSSYLSGIEHWTGSLQVDDAVGERIININNGNEGFVFRSESNGDEQWVLDEKTKRMRRIANRQSKKLALGTVLSYEDLLKLPIDILKNNHGFEAFSQTDSTYEMSVSLGRSPSSFYSKAEAVVSKSPMLIRSLILFDGQGRRCKQVEVTGYTEVNGKWLLNRFRVTNCDSSATTLVGMKNLSLPDISGLAKRDHVLVVPAPQVEVESEPTSDD